MFEGTRLNARNRQVEGLIKLLFLVMTVVLILPVMIILASTWRKLMPIRLITLMAAVDF